MKVKMIFSLFSLVLVTNVSFSECANPKRTVYAHAFPASMTTVVLSNPSRVSQKVMVKVTATGGEQIYNAWVDQVFGVCISNGSGCDWKMPNGSALSCPSYASCASGWFTLAPGSMKKLAFGSQLRMPGNGTGCDPYNLDAPDAGSMIEISVCEKDGFVLGEIASFFDLSDTTYLKEINGGRPF